MVQSNGALGCTGCKIMSKAEDRLFSVLTKTASFGSISLQTFWEGSGGEGLVGQSCSQQDIGYEEISLYPTQKPIGIERV